MYLQLERSVLHIPIITIISFINKNCKYPCSSSKTFRVNGSSEKIVVGLYAIKKEHECMDICEFYVYNIIIYIFFY